MRRIKFNFWDSKNNIMYKNPAQLALCSTGGVSELEGHDDYLEWKGTERTKHIIPLQYTGLKDKDGVEIYERDILEYTNSFGGSVRKNILVVRWSDTDSAFLLGGIRTDYAARGSVVIGNIYENPELLV